MKKSTILKIISFTIQVAPFLVYGLMNWEEVVRDWGDLVLGGVLFGGIFILLMFGDALDGIIKFPKTWKYSAVMLLISIGAVNFGQSMLAVFIVLTASSTVATIFTTWHYHLTKPLDKTETIKRFEELSNK